MSDTNTPQIDLAALEAEIAALSPEEIAKQLVDLRTKQKVNQAKHQGSAAQKLYMKKKSEQNKLMAAKAKAAPRTDGKPGSLYDQIMEQAKANAEKIIADKAQDAIAEEEPEEVEA